MRDGLYNRNNMYCLGVHCGMSSGQVVGPNIPRAQVYWAVNVSQTSLLSWDFPYRLQPL